MSERPKLIKRMQRKVLGGTAYIRIYDDGRTRVRFDHPSNDPAVEFSAATVITEAIADAWSTAGIKASLVALGWISKA